MGVTPDAGGLVVFPLLGREPDIEHGFPSLLPGDGKPDLLVGVLLHLEPVELPRDPVGTGSVGIGVGEEREPPQFIDPVRIGALRAQSQLHEGEGMHHVTVGTDEGVVGCVERGPGGESMAGADEGIHPGGEFRDLVPGHPELGPPVRGQVLVLSFQGGDRILHGSQGGEDEEMMDPEHVLHLHGGNETDPACLEGPVVDPVQLPDLREPARMKAVTGPHALDPLESCTPGNVLQGHALSRCHGIAAVNVQIGIDSHDGAMMVLGF